MQILYIANARMPTQKAHGLQIAKTVEALQVQKVKVTCLFPKRKNPISQSVKKYYQTKKMPKVIYMPCLDLLKQWKSIFSFYLQSFTFFLSTSFWLITQTPQTIYTRDWPVALYMPIFKQHRLFLEIHQFPNTYLGRLLLTNALKRTTAIVSTNPLLSKKINKITDKKITTIPNGVDPHH